MADLPGEIEAGSSWAGVRGTAWGNLAAQGDPADLVQVVLVVLTVPLSWELVHCRDQGPHCSSVKHTRIKDKQK